MREDDAGQVGTGTSARWCWDKRDDAACWDEREMVLHVVASARWCWSWEEEVEVEVEVRGGSTNLDAERGARWSVDGWWPAVQEGARSGVVLGAMSCAWFVAEGVVLPEFVSGTWAKSTACSA